MKIKPSLTPNSSFPRRRESSSVATCRHKIPEATIRRAVQTAKKLAEKNNTPYVVAETKNNGELQQVKSGIKQ